MFATLSSNSIWFCKQVACNIRISNLCNICTSSILGPTNKGLHLPVAQLDLLKNICGSLEKLRRFVVVQRNLAPNRLRRFCCW